MKIKRWYIVLLAALAACGGATLAGLAGYNLVYFVQERWAPTSTPPPATVTPVPSATSSPTPAPVCGELPIMYILLIGSDSRADSYAAGLADAIRIVRVDFLDPGISYLVLPRDLYVEIPGIASYSGITQGKLNQAYLYGNPGLGYSDEPGQGPGLLARTLAQNLGGIVDRYVAINLQAFARIVDRLGGLDIVLPYTVDGRAARSFDQTRVFPAGTLHLDGYRTMLLARMRPFGDLERSRIQNLMLQSFAAKLLAPGSLPMLPSLAETLYGSVQTDLTAGEIAALLCVGGLLEPENIKPLVFPDELLTGTRVRDPVLGNTFIWEANFDELRELVGRFNDGTWTNSDSSLP
jgi:LCP family protein required for cell wall assembly